MTAAVTVTAAVAKPASRIAAMGHPTTTNEYMCACRIVQNGLVLYQFRCEYMSVCSFGYILCVLVYMLITYKFACTLYTVHTNSMKIQSDSSFLFARCPPPTHRHSFRCSAFLFFSANSRTFIYTCNRLSGILCL